MTGPDPGDGAQGNESGSIEMAAGPDGQGRRRRSGRRRKFLTALPEHECAAPRVRRQRTPRAGTGTSRMKFPPENRHAPFDIEGRIGGASRRDAFLARPFEVLHQGRIVGPAEAGRIEQPVDSRRRPRSGAWRFRSCVRDPARRSDP